jgi:hypothetical protein
MISFEAFFQSISIKEEGLTGLQPSGCKAVKSSFRRGKERKQCL